MVIRRLRTHSGPGLPVLVISMVMYFPVSQAAGRSPKVTVRPPPATQGAWSLLSSPLWVRRQLTLTYQSFTLKTLNLQPCGFWPHFNVTHVSIFKGVPPRLWRGSSRIRDVIPPHTKIAIKAIPIWCTVVYFYTPRTATEDRRSAKAPRLLLSLSSYG